MRNNFYVLPAMIVFLVLIFFFFHFLNKKEKPVMKCTEYSLDCELQKPFTAFKPLSFEDTTKGINVDAFGNELKIGIWYARCNATKNSFKMKPQLSAGSYVVGPVQIYSLSFPLFPDKAKKVKARIHISNGLISGTNINAEILLLRENQLKITQNECGFSQEFRLE